MEATVQAFNNLPRPQTTPTGLLNHWYFSIRHVPLHPSGDLVHFVHPLSHLVHCEGPHQILSLPSLEAKADLVAPLLLKAFLSGLSGGPNGEPLPEEFVFTPWSWATKDPDLARAIEEKLKDMGVREELCSVQWGNKEEDDIADESWSTVFAEMIMTTGPASPGIRRAAASNPRGQGVSVCHICKEHPSPSKPLKFCSECRIAVYCSQECQIVDWKEHKKICGRSPTAFSGDAAPSEPGNPKLNALDYYNKIAHTIPSARALAKSMNLALPIGGNHEESILKPIRRLVIAGEDTPDNLRLLLGPNWEETAASVHETARLDILLRPPQGSISHAMHSKIDAGSPSWSPRAAGNIERQKIRRIREIQSLIRLHPNDDIHAILSRFGPKWQEGRPFYDLAVNTMDQGIRMSGSQDVL